MGGFYRMDYQGQANAGAGALAFANGKVAGLDVGGGVYRGSYVEEAGRLRGTVVLTFEAGGGLVTGAQVPPGTEIPIPFEIATGDLPAGHMLTVSVAGRQVSVRLTWVASL